MTSSEQTSKNIFNFIKQHIAQNGFAPTIRERAAACYVGRSSVIRHLDRLEKWGWISRQEGKSRSIIVERDSEKSK